MGTRRSIRLGMAGGGPGSGIGSAHRHGAGRDGTFKLAAGVFSGDPDKNAQTGEPLGLDPERVYAEFKTMAVVESKLTNGIRAVSVVTPNDSHVPARIRSWAILAPTPAALRDSLRAWSWKPYPPTSRQWCRSGPATAMPM